MQQLKKCKVILKRNVFGSKTVISNIEKKSLKVRLARRRLQNFLKYIGKIWQLNAKEELRLLGNELTCLTNYPVGSAFDKLKLGLVPKQETTLVTTKR